MVKFSVQRQLRSHGILYVVSAVWLGSSIYISNSMHNYKDPSSTSTGRMKPEQEANHTPTITTVGDNTNPTCFAWNNDADKWWEYHPDWEVSSENENELCFSPMNDTMKAAYFRKLHGIQYNNASCQDVTTKYMWSSGFGADMSNVVDGLAYSIETDKPFQITMRNNETWHYAGFKEDYRNGRPPVCPSADMFCYFLPLGSCRPGTELKDDFLADQDKYHHNEPWLRGYATRPQQWLRHRVMIYISKNITFGILLDQQCAVVHIRRTDVVLHGNDSRKYFPVQVYLTKLKEKFPDINNILLFTDDTTDIEEANKLHHEYNWMYLEKKRHRGSEGGWENQIPSDSPADELIAILTEFRLAQNCNILVHTASNFAEIIYKNMVTAGKQVERIRADNDAEIFHQNNSASEAEITALLE